MKPVATILLAAALAALAAGFPAAAKDAKDAKVTKQTTEAAPVEVRRSLFSGSESRLAELGWISPDCTPSTPEVRMVKPPEHGSARFEEAVTAVAGEMTPLQRQCRGKPIYAVRVFYKANEDFSGTDGFSIDVDTKIGFVKRYTFRVDVR